MIIYIKNSINCVMEHTILDNIRAGLSQIGTVVVTINHIRISSPGVYHNINDCMVLQLRWEITKFAAEKSQTIDCDDNDIYQSLYKQYRGS